MNKRKRRARMSNLSFFSNKPFYLECGENGRKQFKRRGRMQDVVDEFMNFLSDGYNQDVKRIRRLLYGKRGK